eukprot:Plantae.Rhodophyta-Purpureofilum_apyrenoidigerum.ctg7831.p1 GENE.Plantae.Rhodophyta-Purpureofilum_apyrenoidigerum.ctg7831~~Plantae.Rhodophyta-Purpureofilum_apyrenoidigerum.ctg7831.p1  ORF type:complete len:677 (+),score=120.34 Plantae.Rhodophyta-Purpureofilum_apyrenoidigerum.ctg7831:88-2031(+)
MAVMVQRRSSTAVLAALLCVLAASVRAVPRTPQYLDVSSVKEEYVNLLRPRLAVDTDRGGFVTCSSAEESHVLVGVENSSGQAKELLLHSVGENQVWERSLKLELNLNVHESVQSCHVNPERGLVFATKALFDIEDSPCANGRCWKVVYWRYTIDDNGFSVKNGPVELEGVEDSQYMGIRLHSSDRLLVVDHFRGFVVYDLDDPALRRSQSVLYTDAVADLPEGWDLQPLTGRDMSSRYYAISLLQVNQFAPSQDKPVLVLYERAESVLAYRQQLDLSDFFPGKTPPESLYHYFTISIDRQVDDLIMVGAIGMSRTGKSPSATRDMSDVFTLRKVDTEWVPESAGLRPAVRDSDSNAGFGDAISCDGGKCIVCFRKSETTPSCQAFARADDGSWSAFATLDVVSHAFATTLRGDTAIVRGEGYIRAYALPPVSREVAEDNDESWMSCFSASSTVTVVSDDDRTTVHKPLSAVVPGDRVLSTDSYGQKKFSEVFLVQHAADERSVALLTMELEDESGARFSLAVTAGHLLAVGLGEKGLKYERAGKLAQGDVVIAMTMEGKVSKRHIHSVSRSYDAVRNVHTMSDHVVVDGVVASCMTDALNSGWNGNTLHRIGSALLMPLKVTYVLGVRSLVPWVDSVAHRMLQSVA